jgi:two-component system, sensor histidine kinase LadS
MLVFAHSQASNTVTLTDSENEYEVSAAMEIMEDPTGQLTIDDILSGRHESRFVPSLRANPQKPQSKSSYWLRFTLHSSSQHDNWLLELRNGYMGIFDLYFPQDGEYTLREGGFFRQFKSSRYFAYEFLTHRLDLKPGEAKVYYIRAASPTPIMFSLYVVDEKRFVQRATALEYALGIYYGIIIVLFIYSIFNYIALRNKSYLSYGFYVLCIALLIFCIDGRMNRYVTHDHPYLNLKVLDIIMMLSIFFGIQYGQSFLNSKACIPRFDKGLQAIKIASIVLALGVLPFISIEAGVAIAQMAPIPAMVMIMLAGWLCYRKGYKPARLFLLGFGVFSLGGTISNLAFSATIPSNVFSIYAIHIGSALEAVILVFGLSQQMRLMKLEKESAQEETIKQLKENEHLQTKVNRELEQKVRERTAEIEAQKVLIEEKNKDITDSIIYARRIQQAILPDDTYLADVLKEHFVLYKPKDIVSGDFYWTEHTDGKALFAAVDCTGHGVPGAFVSLLGYNGLNQAVNEKRLSDPGEILNELNGYMQQALKHSMHQTTIKDGMDIALCSLDRQKQVLHFSGAVNPAYIVRNGEIIILKGDRFPIGGEQIAGNKKFSTQEFPLEKGDTVYIFSDGYADQFGGEKGKKFMSKQFKELLAMMTKEPLQKQKQILESRLNEWRGPLEQVDDVLVIGVRI